MCAAATTSKENLKGKPLKFYLGPDNEYDFIWQSYEVDLGAGGAPVAFKKIAYTNKDGSAVGVLCVLCVLYVLWRVSGLWHGVFRMASVSHVFCLSCLSLPSLPPVDERGPGVSAPERERTRKREACVAGARTLERMTQEALNR